MRDDLKTEEARIRGCQSQVWMHGRLEDGKVVFDADSDAILVKGIVALLLRVYSHQAPAEILSTPPDFVGEIGLESKLSPSPRERAVRDDQTNENTSPWPSPRWRAERAPVARCWRECGANLSLSSSASSSSTTSVFCASLSVAWSLALKDNSATFTSQPRPCRAERPRRGLRRGVEVENVAVFVVDLVGADFDRLFLGIADAALLAANERHAVEHPGDRAAFAHVAAVGFEDVANFRNVRLRLSV